MNSTVNTAEGVPWMKFECDDILVFKTTDKTSRSRISKVDGYVVKLFEENGSYRQMSKKGLEEMIRQGFVDLIKAEKP
jgi:hypothetical protein